MIDDGVRAFAERVERRETFVELNPDLAIGDAPFRAAAIAAPSAEELRLLRTEGYAEVRLLEAGEAARRARAIRRVKEAGLHPLFAYVYDELWSPLAALDGYVAALLGEEWEALADFWAWQIEPAKGSAGWPPHRGMYEAIEDADGTPRVLTAWIALTDATPLNSCMYIVPRSHDANQDLRSLAFDAQHARALPVAAGTALLWSANAIHWGGASSERAREPRISFSYTLQAKGETGHRTIDRRAPLPFEARLDLIADQIATYAEQERLAPEIRGWAALLQSMKRLRA